MDDQDYILHTGISGVNSSLIEENFQIYLSLKNNPDSQINGLMTEEDDDE
tara:strand:- start:4198 stop:4347 length:150 start_codon:yes stop_codon:yes gene_type:complete